MEKRFFIRNVLLATSVPLLLAVVMTGCSAFQETREMHRQSSPSSKLAPIHNQTEPASLQPAPEKIPILMYHSISNHPDNTLCVSPQRFAAEMKHLHDAGYHTIGFNDLENGWIHHRPLPPKPILLTLDDGYEDNYRAAYPVLMQYQLQATIFITTGAVGRPNRLTWNEILTMDREGRVQFGSHTVDHLDLRQLTVRQQQHEIQQSKADLEQHLGHPIIAFCFPSGRFNESTLQILQQSHYIFAVTTRPGYADDKTQGPWTLHRVRVSGDESAETFAALFP